MYKQGYLLSGILSDKLKCMILFAPPPFFPEVLAVITPLTTPLPSSRVEIASTGPGTST